MQSPQRINARARVSHPRGRVLQARRDHLGRLSREVSPRHAVPHLGDAAARKYIIKGFTLDDERLKRAGGGNYFDELLARIRDVQSSGKVFWRKVLDIYATSIDYDPRIEASRRFFKPVQNKMHWGRTATPLLRSSLCAPTRHDRTWAHDLDGRGAAQGGRDGREELSGPRSRSIACQAENQTARPAPDRLAAPAQRWPQNDGRKPSNGW